METICPKGCTRSAQVKDSACEHGYDAPVAETVPAFGVHIVPACLACDPAAQLPDVPTHAALQCGGCAGLAVAA